MRASIAAVVTLVLVASGMLAISVGATAAGPGRYCAMAALRGQPMVCAAAPEELSAARGRLLPDTQFLIARLYDNANYDTTAGYLEVYAAGDCTLPITNIDSQIADLSTWSNRISSFKSFGSCATRLWTGTSFTGTAYPSSSAFITNATSVGSVDNLAKSAQFS